MIQHLLTVAPLTNNLTPSKSTALQVGDELALTCSTSSSNPESDITWGGLPNNAPVSHQYYKEGDYRANGTISTARFSVTKEDDGSEITCVVQYGDGDASSNATGLDRTVRLNVTCKYMYY